jgi:excisionase family DNA binding protein
MSSNNKTSGSAHAAPGTGKPEPSDTPRFMNVREVARYLQVNEKKVYALVNAGRIPATRLTGKWLFPRDLVDQWMLESSHGGLLTDRMVIAGSDDPLLYRALMLLAAELRGQALVSYAPPERTRTCRGGSRSVRPNWGRRPKRLAASACRARIRSTG